MTGVAVLERAGEQVGAALPGIGAALLVLVAGLVAVRLAARLVVRALRAARIDDAAERARIHDVLVRAGLERSLSRVVGTLVRVGGSIAVVLAALAVSGLDVLQGTLDEALLFLPRVVAALALVLAGLVLGGWARERVDRIAFQMDLRGPLGAVAQGAVVAIFLVTALGQLGVPTGLLTVLAAVVLGGATLTVALAFGLGGREVARAVSAGRYVAAAFRVGDVVEVAGHTGEVVALEPAWTTLRTDDGRILRVPNQLFLEGVVATR
jgi:small-conductance mechanosensitive channel